MAFHQTMSSNPLLLQATISFLIGGSFVALLSLLAERLPKSAAGIVLMLPSTFAISLLFLGLNVSEHVVQDFLPVLPFSLAASYFFCAVYALVASRTDAIGRVVSVVFSVLIGTVMWLLLSFPLVLYSFEGIALSLVGYAVLICFTHWLLTVYLKTPCKRVDTSFTHTELGIRSIVAGFFIALVVVLGKVLGPVWGGLFTIFPAAMLSSFSMIHLRHGPQVLSNVSQTICFTSPQFILYAFVAAWSFPLYGVWIGSVLGYGSAAVYCIVLHRFLRR